MEERRDTAGGPGSARRAREAAVAEQLAADLGESGTLPEGVTAEDAVAAALCVLSRRLTGGEAREVLAPMPETVREMVTPCARHGGEPRERFDRGGFLRRLGSHLDIDDAHAEALARAVFAAVQRALPGDEVAGAASQLPADLESLWRGDAADAPGRT